MKRLLIALWLVLLSAGNLFAAAAATTTPNLGLTLPFARDGSWGDQLNDNLTIIDALFPGGIGGPAIQDEGVDLARRLKLNFVGSGVSCVVSSSTQITCTITGGGGGGGGGAPVDAPFIVTQPHVDLTNEFPLSTLATGLLKNNTGTGIPTIAIAGTDYVAPGGNVATATALAVNPSPCTAGLAVTDIAADGTLTCADFATQAELDSHANSTSAHGITSSNSPNLGVQRDASGNFAAGTITATLSGNASTATALAADPSACGSDNFVTDIAANGTLTCNRPSFANLSGTLSESGQLGVALDMSATVLQGAIPLIFEGFTGNNFETSVAVTDPTADRTFTIPDADSVAVVPSTCGGTQKVTGVTAAGVITCDDDEVAAGGGGAPTDVEYIIGSGAGTVGDLSAERIATDTATIDYDNGTAGQAKWNVIMSAAYTWTGTQDFSAATLTLPATVTTQASTAAALASNPSPCSANNFVTDIAADGTLTCAQPAAADLSNGTTGTGAVVLGTRPTIVLQDSTTTMQDNADNTKIAAFELSGITTGTTRTYTFPNATGTIALTSSNVASATALAATVNCPTNQYSHSLSTTGTLTCSQVAFSQMTGSASSTQINTGDVVFSSIVSPSQLTADQNNYSISATATIVRLSSDATRNITGITTTNQVAGRTLIIHNVGSQNIVLADESASSTAANRIALPLSDLTMLPDTVAVVQYDATTQRWRAIGGTAGGITGSGTTNALARFTASTAIGASSMLTDDGTTFGVGTGNTGAMSLGSIQVNGTGSGTVTIQPGNAAAGTYNFNLPTSAGTSGLPLLSGGGGSNPHTYGVLGLAAGGTNQNSWIAARCVQVNASGTALESAAAACGSGGGGSGAFSDLTSGTSTGDAFVIGNTSTLDFTGTGTINATTVRGNEVALLYMAQTSDPNSSNNTAGGYPDGTMWINTTANPDKVWIKTAESAGTATWTQVGATSVLADPGANGVVVRTALGTTTTASGGSTDGTNLTFTSGSLRATSPRFTTAILDSNGNIHTGILFAASAVNYLDIANAATGNHPAIAASGTDSNINITLTPKGTGVVTIGGSGANIAKLSNLTTNGFVKTGSGDGTLSVSTSVGTSDLANNAVTSAKMAVVNTRRTCMLPIGNGTDAIVDADFSPFKQGRCYVPFAATIVEITAQGDTGTASFVLQRRRDSGTVADLLSGELASAGTTEVCAMASTAQACINGTTSSGTITLSNTSLSAGDWIEVKDGTGDTTTALDVAIVYTVN